MPESRYPEQCPRPRLSTTRAMSRLGSRDHPQVVLQSKVVVSSMVESLLASEIPLSGLNGYVPQQELNLLKLSACQVT